MKKQFPIPVSHVPNVPGPGVGPGSGVQPIGKMPGPRKK